jgi:hypothetical protein
MPGFRRLFGVVLLLACAEMVGCGGSPSSTEYHPPPPSHGPDPQAVMAKLCSLSDEGQGRYQMTTNTHADVSAWYLAGLDAIDLSGCPAGFADAFEAYKRAWQAVHERSRKPPDDKRGISNYPVLFQEIKDELLPVGRTHIRDDDPLLNDLLLRARDLKRAAGP